MLEEWQDEIDELKLPVVAALLTRLETKMDSLVRYAFAAVAGSFAAATSLITLLILQLH